DDRFLHPFPTRRSSDLMTSRRGSSNSTAVRASPTRGITQRGWDKRSNVWTRRHATTVPSKRPSSGNWNGCVKVPRHDKPNPKPRSEEHTSELQSRENLV